MDGGGAEAVGAVRSDTLELLTRFLRTWEKKWVVLEQNALKFYRPAKPGEELGKLLFELPCDKIMAVTGPTSEHHTLFLQTGRYTGFHLKCFTEERAADWKQDILYRACKKSK